MSRIGSAVLAATLALCSAASAQTFHRVTDSAYEERLWDVERTPDGGYVSAGECRLPNAGGGSDLQALIVKHDALGAVEWWVHYGDEQDQWATSVDNAPGGGYIVACVTLHPDNDQNIGVIRLDAGGGVVWAHRYEICVDADLVDPVRGEPFGPAVRTRAGGGYVVVGSVPCEEEAFVLRLVGPGGPFPEGSVAFLRHHRLDDPNNPALFYTDVKELDNGDFLVSGASALRIDAQSPESRSVLVRMDDLGNQVWANSYIDDHDDPIEVGCGVDVTPDGLLGMLASGIREADVPLLYGTVRTRLAWVRLNTGEIVRTDTTVGFQAAMAGVRVSQSEQYYEARCAGWLRSQDDAGWIAAVAGATDNVGNPGGGSLLGVYPRWFYEDGPHGGSEAVAPPIDAACNWIYAGWGRNDPVGPTFHDTLRLDFLGFAHCGGSRFGTIIFENTALRAAASVVNQPVLLFDFEPWPDGSARAMSLGEVSLCSGQLCENCQADLAEPFGELNFDDVVAFLLAFGNMEGVADLAMPFGQWDFSDVIAFLTEYGSCM